MKSLAEPNTIPGTDISTLSNPKTDLTNTKLGQVDETDTYRQIQFNCINRLVERPSKLMLPQGLHHNILHILQLVGLPARFIGISHLRRRRIHRALRSLDR